MEHKMRLIDCEQAKRATYEEIFWTESEQAVVRNFLAKIPRVDAVEVVRCKDCVYYINLLENGNDYRCSIFCGCYDRPYPTEADDFCSYGVKKGKSNISRKCDGVKVFCDSNCDNCLQKETWDRLKEVFDEIYDDEDGERKDNENP